MDPGDGIGPLAAMTLLPAIGDIQGFAHRQQLVGYASLGARVDASGGTFNTGHHGTGPLDQLGISEELTELRYRSHVYRLSP